MNSTVEVERNFKDEVLNWEKVVLGDVVITRKMDTKRNETAHIKIDQTIEKDNDEEYLDCCPVKLGEMFINLNKHPIGEKPDYLTVEFFNVNPFDDYDYEHIHIFIQQDGKITLSTEKDSKEITISDVTINEIYQALNLVDAVKTIKRLI